MECKFSKHGIALSYDQVVKPCCEWKKTTDYNQRNHISKVDLATWHINQDMLETQEQLASGNWPESCINCYRTENQGRGDSIRGNGNHSYQHYTSDDITLEIRPGNTCNFACQTCWPEASSKVAQYYHQAGLIDISKLNSNRMDEFEFLIPISNRIKDVILLGGEPFYDKSCKKFLLWANENLTANLMLFTNGSMIDYEFLKSYPGRITLIFSLDAINKPAEYIRYGTIWNEVLLNYKQVRELSNVDVRVNITCSVYNYIYLEPLIQMLCSDWPGIVTFGKPNALHFLEGVIPIKHRSKLIDSLARAVELVKKTDIELGQQQNAVNAINSHIINLQNQPWDNESYNKFTNFVSTLDNVKGIQLAEFCPELAEMLSH